MKLWDNCGGVRGRARLEVSECRLIRATTFIDGVAMYCEMGCVCWGIVDGTGQNMIEKLRFNYQLSNPGSASFSGV